MTNEEKMYLKQALDIEYKTHEELIDILVIFAECYEESYGTEWADFNSHFAEYIFVWVYPSFLALLQENYTDEKITIPTYLDMCKTLENLLIDKLKMSPLKYIVHNTDISGIAY